MRNRLMDVRGFEGVDATVYLSPQKISDSAGGVKYQFVVQLRRHGGPFVLIKPGRSLGLLIDGKRYVYNTRQGSGPRRVHTVSYGKSIYSESAIFDDVTEHDISRIAQAAQVNVVIGCKSSTITAKFSEQNFAAFEAMMDKLAQK